MMSANSEADLPAAPLELQQRPPLKLPNGSVRAMLTLMIVALTVGQIIREQPLSLMLGETLMVALAHYFTSRRLLNIPARLREQLETQGILTQEHHPLYLPRNTVRILIVLAFVAVAGFMVWAGRIWAPAVLGTLGLVFSYFLGVVVSALIKWASTRSGSSGRAIIWWEDAKAVLVIATTGALAIVETLGYTQVFPQWLVNGSFSLILFYFGSR